jgi:gluconokinase
VRKSISPVVVVLMGVAGSGKSTIGTRLSKILGWQFRDADSFHPPANIEKMSRGVPLDDSDRRPWLAAIAAWIDQQLAEGKSAIVSCSALKRAYRDQLIGARGGVQLVYLKGSRRLIGVRLQARKGHFMPASLLKSQFEVLEEPQPDENAIIIPVTLPPPRVAAAIIQRLGASRQA